MEMGGIQKIQFTVVIVTVIAIVIMLKKRKQFTNYSLR